jgi:rsbT antagonist protein RsbS
MIINNMSVVKVRDILLVTIPGDPDDQSVSALQRTLLQALEKYESKGVILDLSQVNTLDSYFARTIVETAQMVALMGGQTIFAGMQVGVAITATQLGLSLDNLQSALTVDLALDELEKPGPRSERS